jgi:hypothetical protein
MNIIEESGYAEEYVKEIEASFLFFVFIKLLSLTACLFFLFIPFVIHILYS